MIELKTREDYVKAHRLLWDWLAKNPDMEKSHWPGWRKNDGVYMFAENFCFACEWRGEKNCHGCLLVWPDSGFCNVYNEDLFLLWETERNPTKRATLARQIRDLPVRDDENAANEKIVVWNNIHSYSDNSEFVDKLAKIGLTKTQTLAVLNAIDNTCNNCWDADSGCQCWRDE
jgi:hypothetical protein